MFAEADHSAPSYLFKHNLVVDRHGMRPLTPYHSLRRAEHVPLHNGLSDQLEERVRNILAHALPGRDAPSH